MIADEAQIRADERKRISKHLKAAAIEILHDRTSDAIDGYAAAVVLDLADRIGSFDQSAYGPSTQRKD